MIFANLHIKFFTIFLSLSYVFGLCAYYAKQEIMYAFLILLLLVFAILYLKIDFKKILILYLIFFAGIIRAKSSFDFQNALGNIKTDDVILQGQIISSKNISTKNKKIKFFLKTNDASKVLVSLDLEKDIENKIQIGDFIEIKGNLRSPSEARNPYQFDYKRYLLNQECESILYDKNTTFKKIKKSEFGKNKEESWYFLLNQFEKTRNKIS